MSWYRTGTVTVTNGSKTVTGVGTLWTTAVNAGDAFALVDANLNPTGAWYEVESVTNNTTLVLKQSYAGSTGSNKQYAVFNLVGNMTTPSFAQRLATFFASFQSLIDKPTTTPTASSIPIADANGDIDSGWIKDATASVKGVVELATAAEATAGNDTTRAITPSVSGSRITFATTSTDDATSATAAPLKSAGGLAVAGNVWIAKAGRISDTNILDLGGAVSVGGGQTRRVLFTLTSGGTVCGPLGISVSGGSNQAKGAAWYLYGLTLTSASSFGVHQLFKAEEAGFCTIGNPTWASTTSFYLDIVNTSASSAMSLRIQALFSSTFPVTITSEIL